MEDKKNSAIKTLEVAIRGLEMELKTWSDPRNFSYTLINECNEEKKEHEHALEILKKHYEQS